ncbi:MAG TPA: hypothetical protein G4O05_10890 [Caldilineae bacterium]|nr:hypothetical protein [Caldilineae bacterium]
MTPARFELPGNAKQAHQRLLSLAPDAVLIGGAVRDLLLGRALHDLDYVVTGDALDIGRRLADALGAAYYPLDEARRIARIVWQSEDDEGGRLVVDIASLIGVTLLEDIQRRDFTLNAIALLPYGDLYDPLGGAADLESRVLRPCSPDSLLNDPVRTIRAVRFIQEFDLKPASGLDYLVWHAAPYLKCVSPERQRDEFLKVLALARPHLAVERMSDWRIVDVMLPELMALQGVEQPPPHRFDVFQHTIQTLRWTARLDRWLRGERQARTGIESRIQQRLSPHRDALRAYLETPLTTTRPRWLWLRFGAIAHDWGKVAALREDEDGRITFYRHEEESEGLAAAWMSRYRCGRQEITFVRRVCAGHMRPMSLFATRTLPSRRARFRLYRDMGDAAPAIILLFLADFLGARGEEVDAAELDAALEHVAAWLQPFLEERDAPPAPLLNGEEIIQRFHLKPGPEIGRLLKALQEAQAVGEVQTREEAIRFLQSQLASDAPTPD